jgi:tetratricopeptide (TPR) repeat protein
MGEIFEKLAEHAEARQQYELSHAIRSELARAGQGSAQAQGSLALSFTKLGDISLLEGHRELAHTHYSQALRLREALLAGKQPQGTALIDLATSYVKLGGVSEPEEARRYFGQALKFRQSIAAKTTGASLRFRERDVWITLNKLAELSLRLKDIAAARDYYDQALAQAFKLRDLAPQSIRAKIDLAHSHAHVGVVRAGQGDQDASKNSFREALELLRPLADEDPRNLEVRTTLALVLARHGDHVLAVEQAEYFRGLAPQNYLNLYNVACCYSLSAGAVAGGRSADALTADELALQRRYADQAIATLRQAADHGLKGTEGVVADPDLDAIRSHPEYPRLLETLAAAESSGVTSPAQP